MFVAHLVTHRKFNRCGMKIGRIAYTIQTRHARHDYHIAASREQRRSGTQTHLLDFGIYRKVLFNIGVGRRQICLRLIVVVIRHKILHRIVGEEIFELSIELCRKGFIVAQDDCRTVEMLDDICHRKGLSRPRNTQQSIMLRPPFNRLDKLGNRFGLVTRRSIFRHKFEIHTAKLMNKE